MHELNRCARFCETDRISTIVYTTSRISETNAISGGNTNNNYNNNNNLRMKWLTKPGFSLESEDELVRDII